MPPRIRRTLAMTARAACVTVVAFFSTPGHAAEVHVLSAAAMQSVFKDIRDEFQRTTGYRLVPHYGTIGAVSEWTMGGEEADLIVSSSQSMPSLVYQGKIQAGSQTAICQTGVGVVVAEGIELSVNSVEDFKRALLAARAVVYADPARGGAAGIHVAKVIGQLGLTEQIKPKLRLAVGGDITEVTLSLGPTALGITQISEIVDKPQAQLAGPLPEELQNYTVFVAGVPANALQSDGATALLKFLRSPKAIAVIRAKGMEDFGSNAGSE
ncbi:MAG: substrate-binding domain-containing protein [Pseudolabrys sp.]